MSLLPHIGEGHAVFGSAIGTQNPSSQSSPNVTFMEALGRNLKTLELRGNKITAIEDNTFLGNPNLITL